ncbi:MAG: hypothetical protein ACRDGJ_08105 [Candidatus Limnocylindria bacterium]
MHHAARALRALPVALLLLLSLAAPVAAGDFRGGDTVTVAEGETVSDDMYVGAGTVTIDGTVDGDLTIAAGTVAINGEVTGSLNVAGGTVTVNGGVGGAIRVAGGTVTIAAEVGRDLVVAGGQVTVSSGASIAGDVAGGSGTLTVDGNVGGDVQAAAGVLEVNGAVDGSLDVATDSLRIGPSAVIGGDVLYTSDSEAVIAESAQIGGDITRRDPPVATPGAMMAENPILSFLGLLLGLLVFGFGLLLIRPRLLLGSSAELRTRPWVALGIGAGTWVGQLLLVIALFILAGLFGVFAGSLAGAFVAPALVVIMLIAILAIVSALPVSLLIGSLVMRGAVSPYLAFAVGAAIWAAVLTLAGLVNGGLGFLFYLVVWVLGLGAFTVYIWRTRTQPYVMTPAVAPAAPPADPPWMAPPAAPPPAPPASTDTPGI